MSKKVIICGTDLSIQAEVDQAISRRIARTPNFRRTAETENLHKPYRRCSFLNSFFVSQQLQICYIFRASVNTVRSHRCKILRETSLPSGTLHPLPCCAGVERRLRAAPVVARWRSRCGGRGLRQVGRVAACQC